MRSNLNEFVIMFNTFFLRIVLGSLGLTIKFFLGSREEIIWKIFWRLPYRCSTVADVNSNKWQRMLDLMYKSFWCFSVGGWWRRRGEPSLLLPFGSYVCLWVLVNSLLISNCNYGPLFRSSFRQTLGVSISRLTLGVLRAGLSGAECSKSRGPKPLCFA